MKDPGRRCDLVLFGATGFVGRLTAHHLAENAPSSTRIALAGRSLAKLETLRTELGSAAAEWPLVEADAGDAAQMADLVRQARVVATTVGPYTKYGMPLVEACADAGTHYADLTGEVLFVRRSADAVHDKARASGAKIVHACGFDSVPSDLGVFVTAQRARDDGEGDLGVTTLFVRRLKGGFSGGTIDSMRIQAIERRANPDDDRILKDPYGLSPNRDKEPSSRVRKPKATSALDVATSVANSLPVRRTADGHWTGPFVMATFNTRIVRRSNALLGHSYGRTFRYREVVDFGTSPTSPLRATASTAALIGVAGGLGFRAGRAVLDRVLPKPGDGPSEDSQSRGRFRMEIETTTTTGARYRTIVGAKADPGYSGTAIMFAQSALCLAEDDLDERSGVLTPATAMGNALVDRLRASNFTITTTRLH